MQAIMEERMPSLERYQAAYAAAQPAVIETAALSEAQKFAIMRSAHRQGRIIIHRQGRGSGSSGAVPMSFTGFWLDFGHASIMSESSPPAGHHNTS
ncbi:MAG: hypothetical protein MI724_01270 [Spirochaetales bacterium]|nr:hypothetical protein [Spirochaetales bacterium]